MRYLCVLLCWLVAGMAVLKAPFVQPWVEFFCLQLARLTAGLMGLFDGHVQIQGNIYYWKTMGYAVEVAKSCSGLSYVVTFSAAILAAGWGWVRSLVALIAVFIVVLVVNIARLILLLYGLVLLDKEQFAWWHYDLLPLLMGLSISISLLILWRYVDGRWQGFAAERWSQMWSRVSAC